MSDQKVDPAVIQALVDKVRCSRPPADGISNPILSLNRFCQEHLKFESNQPEFAKEEVGAQIKCTVKLRDEAIADSTVISLEPLSSENERQKYINGNNSEDPRSRRFWISFKVWTLISS
jgi:hypothetical protein